MIAKKQRVFITGGTGYMGRPLITALVKRGHVVRAVVRPASRSKLPTGCFAIEADVLQPDSYKRHISPADTFVHLVGVAHPSPAKSAEFRSIDQVAADGAIQVAAEQGMRHFVYLSVAHPAPMMKAYIDVRSQCEGMLRSTGMNTTILRPWYVLGPGHRWPYALLPMYWVAEQIPATREGARRLGLVTLEQMIGALLEAVEHPATGVRVMEVPEIRASRAYSVLHSMVGSR